MFSAPNWPVEWVLPFSLMAIQTSFTFISWGKKAAFLSWFPCLNLGSSLISTPLFLTLLVSCLDFSSSYPFQSVPFSLIPLSCCHVPSSGWSLKGGISSFFVAHFHIPCVSWCSAVFQVYLDPTSFILLNWALSHTKSGVSLIALHLDWQAEAKPGQQRSHLHAIRK